MSENFAPPAGWYTDPQNAAQQRYWDGAGWTQHVAPAAGALAAAAAVPPTAQGAYAERPKKKGLGTGAIVAIVVGAFLLVTIVVLAAIAVPVFEAQRAKAYDASARADVSTLGREIAIYYVDHDGPAPKIVVANGEYAFQDGTPVSRTSPVSANVKIGGQAGSSSIDWCVWVTSPDGDLKDFEYSAVGGLVPGRCGE